jgi:threonine dehydrogenase-like Zn-dependent dehydrogenase
VRALWLQDGALRGVSDLPAPDPAPGEALVRVLLCGICRTDLELAKGYAGFTGVPGHELVGQVVAAPSSPDWEGRRVVAEINVSCGSCRDCSAGRRPHCAQRAVLGIRGRPGAFAEYVAVPVANLHVVPDGLADDVAVFTEPAAAALEVQEQVPIGPGERVLVIGDGKLGQLLARTLALTGCELRVGGRHPDKLALLARRGIATSPPDALPERWADVAVECTGNPEGVALALRVLRPRGTLVLKSTYPGLAPVSLSAIVVDEITLVGSRCGPFPRALGLLASRRLDVSDLVSAVHPLAEGERAFAAAASPGQLKVLVRVAGA